MYETATYIKALGVIPVAALIGTVMLAVIYRLEFAVALFLSYKKIADNAR